MGRKVNVKNPGILIIPRQEFNSYGESEKLIRYVTRTRRNEKQQKDLISYGGRGVQAGLGIESVVKQFKLVQGMYEPGYREYGRHCYHEYYCLNDQYSQLLNERSMDVLAFQLSQIYWDKGYQVVYGVHRPDMGQNRYHIHFAVNTICLNNGYKWNTTKSDREKRQERFNSITKYYLCEIHSHLLCWRHIPV